MSDDEEYRIVNVLIQQIRLESIMVEVPKMRGWQSIPRSLIHGADEIKIMRWQHTLPQQMAIRVMAWKADELHLA